MGLFAARLRYADKKSSTDTFRGGVCRGERLELHITRENIYRENITRHSYVFIDNAFAFLSPLSSGNHYFLVDVFVA